VDQLLNWTASKDIRVEEARGALILGRSPDGISPAIAGNQAVMASEDPDPYFCPIRFQGQWADEETGLHYNRFRYYDPEAAQYMSPDPIGLNGGMRSQGYVDNTRSWIDPLGLAPSGLPSISKVHIDMPHIMDRHHPSGIIAIARAAAGKGNDVFPEFMKKQLSKHINVPRKLKQVFKTVIKRHG
jgi:RHS repeat-associated protein